MVLGSFRVLNPCSLLGEAFQVIRYHFRYYREPLRASQGIILTHIDEPCKQVLGEDSRYHGFH